MNPEAQQMYDETPELQELLTKAANSPTVERREGLHQKPARRPAGEPNGSDTTS